MCFKKMTWSCRILLAATSIVLMSCGDFEAAQHPDDIFRQGRGLASLEELDGFVSGTHKNPMYREAEVSTQSGPLRLKTEPNTSAPSPSSGETRLDKGTPVLVYWPTDIVNNHIKILYKGQTYWVTYSSGARKYITLLEDRVAPSVVSPGAIVTGPPVPSITGGDLVTAPNTTHLANLRQISLSSSLIDEAYRAIEKMELTPSDVASCTFNPLIGNNSSGERCYKKVVVSKAFRDFVAQHGYSCAQGAAKEAFGQNAKQILFHTSSGGQVKRNRYVSGSSKLSVHATGQAFDLFAVSLVFNGNNVRRVVLHKDETDGSSQKERQNHKFYWSYANCWESKVKAHSSCPCGGKNSGALTYLFNKAHENHIHMSLPFCKRSFFNVSCV